MTKCARAEMVASATVALCMAVGSAFDYLKGAEHERRFDGDAASVAALNVIVLNILSWTDDNGRNYCIHIRPLTIDVTTSRCSWDDQARRECVGITDCNTMKGCRVSEPSALALVD